MNMIESVLGVPASGNGYSVTGFEMTTLSDIYPPRVSVDMEPQLFKEMAYRVNKARDVRMDVFFENSVKLPSKYKKGRKVEKVIYNPPATIVWFDTGNKVVSKVEEGDEFDWEKGLALCVLKEKMNKKTYHRLFPYFDACELIYKKDKNGDPIHNIVDGKEAGILIDKAVPLWDVLVRMECPNGEWEKIKKEWRQK